MVRLRLVGGRLIKDRLEEAARLHAQGDVSNAVTLYREIVREFPRETEALCMLGVIAQQAGNAPLALKFTEIALDIKPDNAKAWYNRSVILRVLGRAQDALESARLAVEHAPDSGEAWDIIGQLFMVQGSYI